MHPGRGRKKEKKTHEKNIYKKKENPHWWVCAAFVRSLFFFFSIREPRGNFGQSRRVARAAQQQVRSLRRLYIQYFLQLNKKEKKILSVFRVCCVCAYYIYKFLPALVSLPFCVRESSVNRNFNFHHLCFFEKKVCKNSAPGFPLFSIQQYV